MGLFDDLYGTTEAAPAQKPKGKQGYTPLQQVVPNQQVLATAEAPELVPSPPPAGLTPKARNEFIANEANRIAAEKIIINIRCLWNLSLK